MLRAWVVLPQWCWNPVQWGTTEQWPARRVAAPDGGRASHHVHGAGGSALETAQQLEDQARPGSLVWVQLGPHKEGGSHGRAASTEAVCKGAPCRYSGVGQLPPTTWTPPLAEDHLSVWLRESAGQPWPVAWCRLIPAPRRKLWSSSPLWLSCY